MVRFIDRQGASDGRFRLLVVPDDEDAPWPDRRYLRQGARANGWVLLENVHLGYEIWRQLNAFPPSVNRAPDVSGAQDRAKSTKKEKP